uniref:NADH-ubiquinone oxidoreductase chain 6 n=1 Tax=Sepedophilus bipunctatus TaxID=1143114 RepID=A0A0S2M8A5_9COLE|nr:NADH dehydrogenase subunit 6 [Sepedophilus bipunctatus]ALO70928.1 NADH deshydrogenase subunit 6 [Sepedophilus bipunctatus]
MLTLNLCLSLLFYFLKHPLTMGLTLIIQTLIISMITGMYSLNYWFSYILFLIMVGGMLVLFIYMTSIASNEKFSFSLYLTTFTMIILMITMTYLSLTKSFNWKLGLLNSMITYKFEMLLIKFLEIPLLLIFILMIIYLLMTLIAIVKITNFKNGPIRQN